MVDYLAHLGNKMSIFCQVVKLLSGLTGYLGILIRLFLSIMRYHRIGDGVLKDLTVITFLKELYIFCIVVKVLNLVTSMREVGVSHFMNSSAIFLNQRIPSGFLVNMFWQRGYMY